MDGTLVHRRVTHSIKVASTHSYNRVERGTVSVQCLTQEQNTMSAARTAQFRDECTTCNHEATMSPHVGNTQLIMYAGQHSVLK